MAVSGEVGVRGFACITAQFELSSGHFRSERYCEVSSGAVPTAAKCLAVGGRPVAELRLSGRSSSKWGHQRSEENQG